MEQPEGRLPKKALLIACGLKMRVSVILYSGWRRLMRAIDGTVLTQEAADGQAVAFALSRSVGFGRGLVDPDLLVSCGR